MKKDYFYIVDRKKDMIIAGGFNIYPREIEEVYMNMKHSRSSCSRDTRSISWGNSKSIYCVKRRRTNVQKKN